MGPKGPGSPISGHRVYPFGVDQLDQNREAGAGRGGMSVETGHIGSCEGQSEGSMRNGSGALSMAPDFCLGGTAAAWQKAIHHKPDDIDPQIAPTQIRRRT